MSLRLHQWLLATMLVALTCPASAFVNSRHPVTGNSLFRSSPNVTFLVNNQTAAGMSNSNGQKIITPNSNPLNAIRAAMSTWNDVPASAITFANPGSTAESRSIFEGQNVITFVDNTSNRQLVGDALAVTVVYFTQSAQIGDSDIVFNPDKVFSTDNEAGTFDLQSVLTHELGHSLGAGHSGLLAATMFQSTKPNSSLAARLTADDAAFATSLYPEPGVLAQFGQITGSLQSIGGVPIFGGLVVAVDPTSGVAVGNISLLDGAFAIPALPPGTYYLYAEPADGPVGLANLPSYFAGGRTAFQTVFYGSSGAPVTIAVTAGATLPVSLFAVVGPPTLNIEIAATTTLSGTDLSNANRGPLAIHPGDIVDFIIAGYGLDSPSIKESDLLLLGAGLRIRQGSLRRGDFLAGRPGLRMTVEVATTAPYGTGTIIIKGDTEGVALSAVLKVFTGGTTGGGPPGTLEVNPTVLKFTGPPGSQPGPQTITVGGTNGLHFTVSVTTASGGNWLLVTPTASSVPSTLTVFAIADDLLPGTYLGRITLSAPNASSKTVEVTFVVFQPAPVVFEEGVVNAASFVGGGVVLGEIVSILGSDLGPRQGVSAVMDPQSARLPISVSEVVVYMSGIAAPLFFVRHDQINSQVPYELAGQEVIELEVEYKGLRSQKVLLRVLEARPGIFAVVTGAGQAAALNEDNTVNSSSNPARIGSVVQLFLTGGGTVSPAVSSGQAAPTSVPFPAPQRPVSASIGGVRAAVQFAGLAPGTVGVLQVNLVAPTGFFPRDNVPVIVTVGGAQSPTNVTIAVR